MFTDVVAVDGIQPGNAYMIHAGDWHTFVGRLVGMSTPMLFRFESVSKIRLTNNDDNWNILCKDDEEGIEARKAAEYRHYEVLCNLPISIIAFDWKGQTPQEMELPENPS